MSLSKNIREKIENLLKKTIRDKLEHYQPETEHMPFHHRLLGKDKYALFSFIQSMNTTFGISIWEQVAITLAEGAGYFAERQFKLLGEINEGTEQIINEIHHNLRKGESSPNKLDEIRQIRNVIHQGKPKKHPDSIVDLYLKINNDEFFFDITSAKPNMKEFAVLKLKLLRWTALKLSLDKNANVFTRLAIPYNPYHPKPYERWTLKGLFDMENYEVMIGEEFWNFVAGGNIYEELLEVFENVGQELRYEIDEKFSNFR